MFEPAAIHTEFGDIEEMVRAAGDYLEVADDLRADTLEEARYVSRKSSQRYWILVLAVAVVFLAVFAGRLRCSLASTSPITAGIFAESDQIYAADGAEDPSWALVDAFRGLRQRQASLIDDVL